ncbi:hypothetical protein MKX83_23690 [Cytobacillus sp. FSL M8-0252]|uniref:hypothetical protein n=1 Tax=Cytobacillus sp. FSL M8-0252 TaxID=2921621 RepID=UPI0030F97BA5
MKKEQFKVEGMDTEFVEFRHKEHNILFTRFERIRFKGEEVREESKYLYLIYIFRKKHRVVNNHNDKKEMGSFNIICFNQVYHTFDEMVHNLIPILSEYILDQDEIFKCLYKVHNLDPRD